MALCSTRWSAAHKATDAIRRNFGAIIDNLADLIEQKHDAAEVTHGNGIQSNLTFEFLVALIFWDSVLLIANILLTSQRKFPLPDNYNV